MADNISMTSEVHTVEEIANNVEILKVRYGEE